MTIFALPLILIILSIAFVSALAFHKAHGTGKGLSWILIFLVIFFGLVAVFSGVKVYQPASPPTDDWTNYVPPPPPGYIKVYQPASPSTDDWTNYVPPPPPGYISVKNKKNNNILSLQSAAGQPTINKLPQNTSAVPPPNPSKPLFDAYESVLSDYSQSIIKPLLGEKQDDLTDKNSTLRINFRDIGQVTVSGSSILINSIGQALAKAMTEKMKDNQIQIDVTPANSTKAPLTASVSDNPPLAQPAAANASPKRESWGKKSPAKTGAVVTANAPITDLAESAPADKTNSSATMIPPVAPERPDWVGKPPHTVGDVYQISTSTGPYSTRQECEEKIPETVQKAVGQYLAINKSQGEVILTPDLLRQLVAEDWEETREYKNLAGSMMTEIHLLVSFDRKAKAMIEEIRQFHVFSNRAMVAGTGLVSVWMLMAVIWGYLKSDLTTKGAYRGRLRLAAGFVILSIVVISMMVLRSLA